MSSTRCSSSRPARLTVFKPILGSASIVTLFGSVLTGHFSESSDIDVLVEFQPQERVGFFLLADVEFELSRLLGGRDLDLRTPMDLSRYFRAEVARDALVVYQNS